MKTEKLRQTSVLGLLILPALLALLGATAAVSLGHVGSHIAVAQACIPAPAGLVSWWQAEGNALDSAGGNDGTLQNGATFGSGLVGQAFSFDGLDAHVRVPDDPSLNVADGLTIAAWLNATSHAGPRVAVSKWNDNTDDWSYIFKGSSSDQLRIELSESVQNDLVNLFGTAAVPLNTWVHVAATYDTNVARLYLNGAQDASQTVGPNRFIDSSVTDLLIGAVFTGGGISENFAGRIDEVQIFDRALSGSEIQSIFEANSAGKCKGVGGIAVDPDLGALPLEAPESSGSSASVVTAIAAAIAVGGIALGGAGWYARRRWR